MFEKCYNSLHGFALPSLFGHFSASPTKAPSPDNNNAGSMAAASGQKLVRVDFEVFGRVQGE